MAHQSTETIVVHAPASEVMAVIADFPAYPEWVAAAKQVEVVEPGDGRARQVHFVLDAGAIKDDYVLEYTWEG
ncbi:MAG: SRPBCC family protein, partial [Nocardioides sp.]